jgi:hypothetical protein
VISTVHPFVQNHRGHYERGMDIAQRHQLTAISPNSPVPSDRGSTPRYLCLLPFTQKLRF